MKIKELGKSDYSTIQYDKEYKNISHIKFVKNDFLPVKSTFKLPYILQFKGKNVENMVNTMQSDLCYLEFSVDYGGNELKCLVDYYHMYEAGDNCETVKKLTGAVKHAHIAEPVSRHFPRTDDGADYRSFIEALEAAGCETCSVEASADSFERDCAPAFEAVKH